jgi:hypothetical protein
MKKAITSPPLMATNTPSAAADLYANRASRDFVVGSGFVEIDRSIGILYLLGRSDWNAAEAPSSGRLVNVEGPPLLKDARICAPEARVIVGCARDDLDEAVVTRNRDRACRRIMVQAPRTVDRGGCGEVQLGEIALIHGSIVM